MSSNNASPFTDELAIELSSLLARKCNLFPGGAFAMVELVPEMPFMGAQIDYENPSFMYKFSLSQNHCDGCAQAFFLLSKKSIEMTGKEEVCTMAARNLQYELFRLITKQK